MSELSRLKMLFEHQVKLQELDKGEPEVDAPVLPDFPTTDTKRPLDADNYELAGKTKKATAAGEFDRVIAKLSAKDSEKFTKLAKDYHQIDLWAAMLEKSRNNLNAIVREESEELFAAEDAWLTRVVETKSMTITLAKKVEQKTTSASVQYDKILEELQNHLTPELKLVAEELVKKYTIAEQTSQAMTINNPKLYVKTNIKPEDVLPDALKVRKTESIMESRFATILGKLKTMASRTLDKVLNWTRSYDKKLNTVSRQISAL